MKILMRFKRGIKQLFFVSIALIALFFIIIIDMFTHPRQDVWISLKEIPKIIYDMIYSWFDYVFVEVFDE